MKQILCDGCGKNMHSDELNCSIIGVSIRVDLPDDWAKNKDKQTRTFLQQQLGKYEGDYNYQFCYECWLNSLHGK